MTYSWRSVVVLLGGLLMGGACGSSSGGGGAPPIASGALAGKVGGQAWTLASAETDAFLSMNQPDFFTTLYTESVAPCTGAGNSTTSNRVITEVPMVAGDYMKFVTFVVDPGGTNQNLVVNGHIVVSQVTATTVSGGLSASLNADNTISGQFQATICAQ
jgi:hypothetical protein